MKTSTAARLGLRTVALGYLVRAARRADRAHPLPHVRDGIGAFIESIRTPAAISALNLSLLDRGDRRAAQRRLRRRHRPGAGARAVPRPRARAGRRRPAVRGLADRRRRLADPAVGRDGWFGGLERLGFKVIFGLPGMVLATLFVTLPFVVREVEPVLHEIGTEQEQAAVDARRQRAGRRSGGSRCPAIRWGLTYGVVLTVARALGEFGARDHGLLRLPRGLPDADPARPLPLHRRPQHLRRLRRGHPADGPGRARRCCCMTLLDRKRSTT